MRWIGVVVACVSGCGRIAFDVRGDGGGGGDGGGSAGGDSLDTDSPAFTCTPIALADDFDDGTVAAVWTRIQPAGLGVTESGGALTVTLSSSVQGYGGYGSVGNYDLRDHCLHVQVTANISTVTTTEMGVQMVTPLGNIGHDIHGGKLESFTNDGTFVTYSMVPYDPFAHAVLQLRESGGTMFWEAAPLGGNFVVMASHATPFDVSSSPIQIGAGTFGVDGNPGSATFDQFDR